MKYWDNDTSRNSSHRSRPVPGLLKVTAIILLACVLTPHANAARLGRIFFTPQQRLDLDHSKTRNASIEDNSSSVLTVNGIVQKRGGPRTVWINGVAQNAGKSDERNPDALSVDLPCKSKPVKIKVGQKLQLDQPARPDVQNQNP